MDDFGVLVKNYGINPKGKSAPMAASKKAPKTQKNYDFVDQDPNFFPQSFSKSNSGNGSFLDDQNDDIFGFNSSNKGQNHVNGDVFDDVLKMPTKSNDFDVESMLNGASNSGNKSVDFNGDEIWGFSVKNSSNVEVGNNSDLLSSDPVDDFWGKIAKLSLDQREVKRLEKNNDDDDDDLIPGFQKSYSVNDRGQASVKEKNSGVSLPSLDELEDFATRGISKVSNWHNRCQRGKTVENKSRETNFFDFDQSSDGGSVHNGNMENVDILFQDEASDLDSFFRAHTKRSTSTTDSTTMHKPYEEPNLFSETAFEMDKKVSPGDFSDDFSFMFEGSAAPGAFEEKEGESDERRRLRFARYQSTMARMNNAVAEMNEREFRAQQEQEEKHRIADAMEMEMKRWAAGKEGNLRALLSSLQQVLGPEFGWRPVSLTDLITSAQVKIAYKKAALCVHPDKVQQRGADLQQKYVAEKAFDLLKEAWNKFSTEELR
ncbi:hypothetical protein RND81_03G076100 [Saponaria officinalis]|uniref:J domain-containing protein n=1 Tax=Saponaria officinalis TaxID=3572 RepID=A0AAW1M4J2_SAPOF